MHWNLTNTVLCSGVVFWAKKRSYCVLAYRVWRCLWSDWRQTWRTDARPTTDTRIIKTHFLQKIELLRFGIVRQSACSACALAASRGREVAFIGVRRRLRSRMMHACSLIGRLVQTYCMRGLRVTWRDGPRVHMHSDECLQCVRTGGREVACIGVRWRLRHAWCTHARWLAAWCRCTMRVTWRDVAWRPARASALRRTVYKGYIVCVFGSSAGMDNVLYRLHVEQEIVKVRNDMKQQKLLRILNMQGLSRRFILCVFFSAQLR